MILEFYAVMAMLVAVAALPKLVMGPTNADRILAAQFIGTGAVAVPVALAVVLGLPGLIDLAMVFAALAALSGIAFVVLKGRAQ